MKLLRPLVDSFGRLLAKYNRSANRSELTMDEWARSALKMGLMRLREMSDHSNWPRAAIVAHDLKGVLFWASTQAMSKPALSNASRGFENAIALLKMHDEEALANTRLDDPAAIERFRGPIARLVEECLGLDEELSKLASPPDKAQLSRNA